MSFSPFQKFVKKEGALGIYPKAPLLYVHYNILKFFVCQHPF